MFDLVLVVVAFVDWMVAVVVACHHSVLDHYQYDHIGLVVAAVVVAVAIAAAVVEAEEPGEH